MLGMIISYWLIVVAIWEKYCHTTFDTLMLWAVAIFIFSFLKMIYNSMDYL